MSGLGIYDTELQYFVPFTIVAGNVEYPLDSLEQGSSQCFVLALYHTKVQQILYLELCINIFIFA